MPSVLDDPCTEKVIQLLIVMICSQNYVTNPYLIAKLVEVLFVTNPNVQPRAEKICEKILMHELSRENLSPALMQFYTGRKDLSFLLCTKNSNLLVFALGARNPTKI